MIVEIKFKGTMTSCAFKCTGFRNLPNKLILYNIESIGPEPNELTFYRDTIERTWFTVPTMQELTADNINYREDTSLPYGGFMMFNEEDKK